MLNGVAMTGSAWNEGAVVGLDRTLAFMSIAVVGKDL